MFFLVIEDILSNFWNWITLIFNTFNFPLIYLTESAPPIRFLDVVLAFSFLFLILKYFMFRH